MSALDVQTASLQSLESLLPRLLQNISLSRAQIAIDQLRGAIQSKGNDRIVLVTVSDRDSPGAPVAAAVAIQQPEADREMATIVHAGPTVPAEDAQQAQWIASLDPVFEAQLAGRGIRFLQWATDPGPNNTCVARWCEGFGFQPVGTLDYLSGDVPSPSSLSSDQPQLQFFPVDLVNSDDYQSFVQLVDETYVNTLDCPALASYRTANETLRGYRTSAAHEPDGWFRAVRTDEAGQQTTIGCVILGLHSSPSDQPDAQSVMEIVYMGIVPSARGLGMGKQLVLQALATARSRSASRLILAVDQKNKPARTIYETFGLSLMLSETVWVKSL